MVGPVDLGHVVFYSQFSFEESLFRIEPEGLEDVDVVARGGVEGEKEREADL